MAAELALVLMVQRVVAAAERSWVQALSVAPEQPDARSFRCAPPAEPFARAPEWMSLRVELA
jgi:hypothetical protein